MFKKTLIDLYRPESLPILAFGVIISAQDKESISAVLAIAVILVLSLLALNFVKKEG